MKKLLYNTSSFEMFGRKRFQLLTCFQLAHSPIGFTELWKQAGIIFFWISQTAVLWIHLGNWPHKHNNFIALQKSNEPKWCTAKDVLFPSFPLPSPRSLWKPLPPQLSYYGKYHLINSSYKAWQQTTSSMCWLQWVENPYCCMGVKVSV